MSNIRKAASGLARCSLVASAQRTSLTSSGWGVPTRWELNGGGQRVAVGEWDPGIWLLAGNPEGDLTVWAPRSSPLAKNESVVDDFGGADRSGCVGSDRTSVKPRLK